MTSCLRRHGKVNETHKHTQQTNYMVIYLEPTVSIKANITVSNNHIQFESLMHFISILLTSVTY